MAINAQNKGGDRTLAPAGNHVARCYQMVHIGTIEEELKGKKKLLNKVRITWELPLEQHVFNEEKGEQPFVVSKDYTLSMHEKANLRKELESWRGKAFTESEASVFDITKLMGVPCMLNVIHKLSASGNNYLAISGISPLPKGFSCPPQINDSFEFNFTDKFDNLQFLPEWLQDKIKLSSEYIAKQLPQETTAKEVINEDDDDLPF